MIKTFCTPQWETVQPSAFTRHPMLINNEHPLTVPQVGMVVLLYCCDFVINSYHESQLKKTRPNPEDSYVSGMQDTEVTRSLLLWTKNWSVNHSILSGLLCQIPYTVGSLQLHIPVREKKNS